MEGDLDLSAQNTSSPTGHERRGKERQEAHQQARIITQGGSRIPAEIRDYCSNGLHLYFLRHNALGRFETPFVGGKAVVELGPDGQAGAPRLEGKIAHISSSEMGLYVEAMPEAVMKALQVSAPAEQDSPGASTEPLPENAEGMRKACAQHFASFQSAVMQDFLARIERVLADARDEAATIAEQVDLRYTIQVLSQHASEIREDFIREGLDRLQHVRKVDSMPGGAGMSLVGEEEFEDWLNLSGVINRLEADFHVELNDIEARFGTLVRQAVDGKSNPFAPAALCRAFQAALKRLDLPNEMRMRFYATFGQVLVRQYPPLFELLGRVLAPLTPPPAAREPKGVPIPSGRESARGGGEQAGPGAGPAAPSSSLPPGPQDQASAAEAAPTAGYSLDHLLSMLNRTASAGSLGGSTRMPSPGGESVAGGGGAASALAAPATSQLMRVASALRERLPPPSPEVAVAASVVPVGDRASLPLAGISDVLRALDARPAPQAGEGVANLVDQVGAQLARMPSGAMRLDPRAEQVLGVMADLLGRALSQYAPSSEIETLVRKLEPPLLKLALTDEGFLDQEDHPARQVVNLLDQFAIAADDKGCLFDPKLRVFLNQLVDRLCAQAEPSAAMYATVAGTLQKILVPIRQYRRLRVARLQEASEGRERIRTARTRVGDALSHLLAGRELPDLLYRVLEAGWQQYLILLELRRGAEGEEWRAALSVVERLCTWLAPGFVPGERYTQDARDLINLVERELATVDVDPDHLQTVVRELETRLLRSEIPTATSMVAISAEYFATGNTAQESMLRRHANLIERLRLGDWWRLLIDGMWVPMQLIWLSRPATSCAFTNRSASHKIEWSLDELAHRLASNLAREDENQDRPLLERSEHAIVDDAYHRLRDQAIRDATTGLLNRKGFMHRLQGLASVGGARNAHHALAMVEFDAFRMIYTQRGIDEAERLSRELAEHLERLALPESVVASFGDETIMVLMPHVDQGHAYDWAHELLQHFKEYRFEAGQQSYSIGVNIGLVEFELTASPAGDVIRHADAACMAAKAAGRNHIHVFEPASVTGGGGHSLMDWAGRIDHMLENDGLFLRFQLVMPIRNYSSLKPYYEILLGVHGLGKEGDPETQAFILAVEQLRRVHEIDMWMLGRVFEWIRANHRLFDTLGGFSLNLSAQSLKSQELLDFLHEQFGEGDIDGHKIIFEITETVAIDSYNTAQDFIQQVKRYGCRFSVDDFGSGHASYAHLKNLRTDVLKIDGTFVKELAESETDFVMVRSMNEIAHSLGMRTVAEYVESQAILDKLRDIGVDYAQGFVIHKPVPIEQLGVGIQTVSQPG